MESLQVSVKVSNIEQSSLSKELNLVNAGESV